MLYAPRSPDTSGAPGLDKVVHLAVFGLVALTAVAAGARPRLVVALLAAHALVSELLQWSLLPGRSGDPWDVVADLLGTLAGATAGHLVVTRAARRRPPEARDAGLPS